MFRKKKLAKIVVKNGQDIKLGPSTVWCEVFENKGLPYFDVVDGPRFYDNRKYGSKEFDNYWESHDVIMIELPYV